MPDFASHIQAALSTRFGERLEVDAACRAWTNLPASPRTGCIGGTNRARLRPICCDCCARVPCRRRRKAIFSRRTSSS